MRKKQSHATVPLGRKGSAEKWVDNFGLAVAARAQTLRFTFRLSSIPPPLSSAYITHYRLPTTLPNMERRDHFQGTVRFMFQAFHLNLYSPMQSTL